jgi:3-methyladenine DNA glycosylase AlkD
MNTGHTVSEVLSMIRKNKNPANVAGQARFGIRGVKSYGMTKPAMQALARRIGRNHELALGLWATGIHEARHIAVWIADKQQVTPSLMDRWLKDFNAWDITDDCCSKLFCRTPHAWAKAMAWAKRKKEFEKRAAFSLMAFLAVHDKKAEDDKFERFLPVIVRASADGRNYVKKAVNWALRQIGKRNLRLCSKAIRTARVIRAKGDPASRWIAADALRELKRYREEGRIKK